ncbi:hypothetical protein FORC47_p438 (plasmid) [Bacillus cereus]|nr:hypothetical protein FORC47_p438 [Bacillus cereus]
MEILELKRSQLIRAEIFYSSYNIFKKLNVDSSQELIILMFILFN